MAQHVIWVFDTSSIIEIRRSVENARRQGVFNSMSSLVIAGRLVFPIEVVNELERFADPKLPDAQYLWAKGHEEMAKAHAPSFEEVKNILSIVPDVLDPDKDSGKEEADPYVLAVARRLRSEGRDARVRDAGDEGYAEEDVDELCLRVPWTALRASDHFLAVRRHFVDPLSATRRASPSHPPASKP